MIMMMMMMINDYDDDDDSEDDFDDVDNGKIVLFIKGDEEDQLQGYGS